MESYSSHPLTGVMVSSNNNFTDCEVGSQGTNSLSCYISENTYTDNYFGSAHIGDSRFLILNNIFQNCANGVNVMMTQNNGNNQIRCNTFTENETGILALGNNAGTLFAFNNLSNSTTNGDNARVTFYAGETIVVPGEIRYAQAWVDPNNPSNLLAAGNLFSSNFSPSREHITTVPASQNSNASMEFIYHHPDPTSEPRVYPFCGIGGTCPSGSTFKFSYFLNEGPFTNECRRSLAGYCHNEDCYDEILAYYSTAKQNYITTPTPTNKELYQVARAFKYNSLDTIIRDHLTRSDFSGLDIILQADDETFAKRARIGLKILEANFIGARLLLSNYPIIEPGDQDFVAIQTINIDRLETKTGLSSQQILDLQVFIDSKSIEKGYARAILSHELDSIYEPEIGDAEITPRSIFESDSEIKVERFSVIPNPTSGLIDIFPNVPIDNDLEYSVFVHGIDGRYILQNIQKGDKIQLDLSGYDSGIYILSILSSDKSFFFTTKIVLAK